MIQEKKEKKIKGEICNTMQSTEFHRNKTKPYKKLLHSCCVLFFSSSKGYQQGYKWCCRATLSSLGILNSLNTNVKVHYINYMACSLAATNYHAWTYIVECMQRNLCRQAALTCHHHRFVAPRFVSVASCFGRADLANCCRCMVKVGLTWWCSYQAKSVHWIDYDFWTPASSSRLPAR